MNDVSVIPLSVRLNMLVYDNGGKTADRYTVVIKRDYWYLSADANAPNGVCMFGGEFLDDKEYLKLCEDDDLVALKSLPVGTFKAITTIVRDWYGEGMDE